MILEGLLGVVEVKKRGVYWMLLSDRKIDTLANLDGMA